MGSKAEITIHFGEDLPEEFSTNEDIQEALKAYYGDDCSIGVYDTQLQDEAEVYFELFSERDRNLTWQHELLIKYLKEKYAEQIVYFSSNIWTSYDDEGIHFEEGDGENFKDI